MLTNKLNVQRRSQQGAALIAVLVILVVITLLGVTAMRMSLTGLTLATNSQISGLLFEAADKGMVDMKNAINQGNDAADITVAMAIGGILGDRGEKSFCVTPYAGVQTGLTSGACSSSTNSFMSARQVIMSQVSFVRSPLNDIDTNASVTTILGQGTGKSGGGLQDRLSIVSTAVMPGVGSAAASTIDGCLSGQSAYFSDPIKNPPGAPISDDTDKPDRNTITDCLTDSGAVFTTHIDDFLIGINL